MSSSPTSVTSDLVFAELDLPAEADDANELFALGGLGSPVGEEQPDEMLLEARLGRTRVGVAYVCAPVMVGYALSQAGLPVGNAAEVASAMRAIEALTVVPGVRRQGVGRALASEIISRVRRDAGVDYVVARVDASNTELRLWYADLGFTVARPGQTLRVDGHAVELDSTRVDAWLSVSAAPRFTVDAV